MKQAFLNYKQRLFKSDFVNSVLRLVSAAIVGQLILVLAAPLLTRIYTPEQFGVLAAFSALLGMTAVISSLRYELAIPLTGCNRDAVQMVYFTLLLNILYALVILIVVAGLRVEIADWFNLPVLNDFLWYIPIGIVCLGGYRTFNYWAIRNQHYSRIAQTKLNQCLANVGVQISAGLIGLGALGLILGQLVGQTVGAFRLAKGVVSHGQFKRKKYAALRLLVLMKRHNRFPKYDALAATIDVLSVQLPNLMLVVLFNSSIAGFYLLAERVLLTPMSLLGQALGQVIYGSSNNVIKNNSFTSLVLKIIKVLGAIIFLPALIIFLLGGELFSLVFGKQWYDAGVFASWLILGFAMQFIYSPLSMVLMATNGQKINLYIHVFMLAAKFSVLLYGFHINNVLAAIIGFSLVTMLGYGGSIFVIHFHLKRYSMSKAGGIIRAEAN